MAFLKLFLLAFSFTMVVSEDSSPIVRIDNGRLKGTWKVSTKGRRYASFMGIPYAMPPVGELRFRAPQPKQPWTGIWDATESNVKCIQYDPMADIITGHPSTNAYSAEELELLKTILYVFYRIFHGERSIELIPAAKFHNVLYVTGNEDCLYLHVHSTNLTIGASLPVMVFIHGGAFMFGLGALYDPSHLMDKDLIVVTCNYRLGPIGFLSTGDGAIPGNAGLKDQSLVLKWVRDNIRRFGGNPNSVTLTGHSAGAACVHYHFFSSLSAGTFHRGLSYSGSAFCPWAYAMKPLDYAKQLAAIMGCPTYNGPQIADCLYSRSAYSIVKAQAEMLPWIGHLFTPFTPTVEGPGSREPFFTEYPYIASKHMRRLPILISTVAQEGLYPAAMYQADPNTLPELNSEWDQLASVIFQYNDSLPANERPRVAEEIKKFYLNGSDVEQKTFPELVKALSDRLFFACIGKFAQFHAYRTRKPTYMYRYSYRAQYSLSNVLAQNDANYGVSHADDIMEIFPTFLPFNITRPEDIQMREVLLEILDNFVSTGEAKVMNGPEWQQVQPRSPELPFLQIYGPDDMKMKSSTDFGNKTFWSSLGFNEDEHYHDEN